MKGDIFSLLSPAGESHTPSDDDLGTNTEPSMEYPHPNPDSQQELGATHDAAGNPHAPASPRIATGREAKEAQQNKPTKSKKAKKNQNQRHQQEKVTMEDMFGIRSESWTKYFILNIAGNLDNVEVATELHRHLPDKFQCSRRRDGSILIDAKTKRNADKIQEMKRLRNCEVRTSRDLQMNSSRGTILVPKRELKDNEDLADKILDNLKVQNLPVSKVHVFKKTSRNKRELLCACITFESRSLPDEVEIGFEILKVKEDIPRPRQCRKCWKFGHATEHCRGTACCPICGSEDHSLETCTHSGENSYKGHCPNCDQDGHTAFSKQCALYRREVEVLATMYKHGITKDKARRFVVESGLFSGVSYARKTALQSDPPRSPPTTRDNQPKQQPKPHQQDQRKPKQSPEHPATESQATASNDPYQEVEQQLSEILGGHEEPFLSMEADSEEASTETVPSQIIGRKRKQEREQLQLSPNASRRKLSTNETKNPNKSVNIRDALQTSSPKKLEKENSSERRTLVEKVVSQPNQLTTSTMQQPEPPSPLSQVHKLDDPRGAIPKHGSNRLQNPETSQKLKVTTLDIAKAEEQSDGQHTAHDNCGCHRCMIDVAIVKGSIKSLDKLRTLLSQHKLYKQTKMAGHPDPCMCISHQKIRIENKQDQPQYSKASTTSKGKESTSSVANLRQQFEASNREKSNECKKRMDPRAGEPPRK